jgi:hypothetical protein
VGNVKGSIDLVNWQEGRGDIPNFQARKGEEMRSIDISHQQGMLIDGNKVEEMPHPHEDLGETISHVNEDDEKLNTSTTKEESQRRFMIIRGIEIFLPSNRG